VHIFTNPVFFDRFIGMESFGAYSLLAQPHAVTRGFVLLWMNWKVVFLYLALHAKTTIDTGGCNTNRTSRYYWLHWHSVFQRFRPCFYICIDHQQNLWLVLMEPLGSAEPRLKTTALTSQTLSLFLTLTVLLNSIQLNAHVSYVLREIHTRQFQQLFVFIVLLPMFICI